MWVVYECYVCAVPTGAKRKHHVSRNWSYTWGVIGNLRWGRGREEGEKGRERWLSLAIRLLPQFPFLFLPTFINTFLDFYWYSPLFFLKYLCCASCEPGIIPGAGGGEDSKANCGLCSYTHNSTVWTCEQLVTEREMWAGETSQWGPGVFIHIKKPAVVTGAWSPTSEEAETDGVTHSPATHTRWNTSAQCLCKKTYAIHYTNDCWI